MADSRISPYSLSDLKNTTDDALGNYLRGLNFKQDNSKMDFRLAVGYVAVIIAAATFVADYKLGWEATKWWTVAAVVVYGLLNALYTYWMWAVEKNLVFEGTRDGKKLSIASKTKKFDPTYYITVVVSSGSSSSNSTWELKTPFTTWFTADGYLVAQPLQKWLASSIEVIGDADPKNSGKDNSAKDNSGKDEKADLAPSTLEWIANGAPEASGVNIGTGKGSKRNKRKG